MHAGPVEMVLARNPVADSTLRYLLRVPLGDGLVFRTSDTWPRTKALFCYPVELADWPDEPEVVERVAVRSCARRGAAIDLVLDRGRENRSQIVYTRGRGREMVFWQSPRTRKQARPDVRTPTARASGIAELEIVADTRERYAYAFAKQQARVVKRALACGDYAVCVDGSVVAAVERKSLSDAVSSLTNGTLRYALGELSALPRAAVVVEDRFSRLFKLEHVNVARTVDGFAELQVRWPGIPIIFCETRPLAEEWTYRYLAAAYAWAVAEAVVEERIGDTGADLAGPVTEPTTAEVRAWAVDSGVAVPPRGRLRREVWDAWREAHS